MNEEFRNYLRRTHHAGFTLIELLVVVAIILILARILLPALDNAKKSAIEVQCVNNLRQLSIAFNVFATDHDGRLPGGWLDTGRANPDERDWLLGGTQTTSASTTPAGGTIYPYVSNNKNIYLCPSRLPSYGAATEQSSNGFTDYAYIYAFAGAKKSSIFADSIFTLANGSTVTLLSPLLVEENGAQWINACCIEGDHGNTDQMSHNHRGGSYYAAIDGSVQYYKQQTTQSLNNWTSRGPISGTQIVLGGGGSWGSWDGR